MSTTKTWLQAISGIQTGKQSTKAISSKDCVSSLLTMVKSLLQKPKRRVFVSTIRYFYGCAVLFLRRVKITGKKLKAGLIFESPLDATFRRLRSDLG
ncbi:hypothetical protein Bca4012_068132 [Brassica carinata]